MNFPQSPFNLKNLFFFICLGIFLSPLYAQVGIGTTIPDPSSALDITSSTQGFLAPRMTTAERTAIGSPAESLLVYDTDENAFYFYETTAASWVKINSSSEKRNNYKLVKSTADLAPELAAGGGTKYLLTSNTYYEINGVINLNAPIDLNNAYVSGLDANEDILSFSGIVFQGSTGGSVRNVTITGGGTAFAISGPGISSSESLILQNTIIYGMANVGTISNVGLYFGNIIQFVGNTTGITYSNIGNLLLNNQAWLGSNGGTYERLTGGFGFVQKVSGFSTTNGTAIGFDVSSNPTVGTGILLNTVFTGTGTFVNGYNPAPYPGYKFTNDWTVNCPGISGESDENAAGNLYYNGTITTGFVQSVSNSNEFNLTGNSGSNSTTAVNLFRLTSPQNNRLTYTGKKTRTFQFVATLSVRGNSGLGDFYAFFIKKNGTTTLTETNTIFRVNNTADISSNSISGTVELGPNDYIEIWGKRLVGSGTTSITVFSLNLSVK